jgi:hypothetical protein
MKGGYTAQGPGDRPKHQVLRAFILSRATSAGRSDHQRRGAVRSPGAARGVPACHRPAAGQGVRALPGGNSR